MKSFFSQVFLAVISSATFLSAADTPLEFSGLMTASGRTLLAITDTAKGTTSWVEPGQNFGGYTIRYDSAHEAIFAGRDGVETRIALASSATQDASPGLNMVEPTPAEMTAMRTHLKSLVATSRIRSNIRALADAARKYQQQNGVSSARYSDLVGPDKLIKAVKTYAGEDYSGLTFGTGTTAASVTTETGVTLSFAVAPRQPVGLSQGLANPETDGGSNRSPSTARQIRPPRERASSQPDTVVR